MAYEIESIKEENLYRVKDTDGKVMFSFAAGVGQLDQYTICGITENIGIVIHLLDIYDHTIEDIMDVIVDTGVLDTVDMHGYPTWTRGVIKYNLSLNNSPLGVVSKKPMDNSAMFRLDTGKRYYISCTLDYPSASMGLFNDFISKYVKDTGLITLH